MNGSKMTAKALIILVLMGIQSLCLGVFINRLWMGEQDILPFFFFSGVSIIVFFYLYMREMQKGREKIRSTEEIIDECWEKYEMEKASRRKKNDPRDQKPGS